MMEGMNKAVRACIVYGGLLLAIVLVGLNLYYSINFLVAGASNPSITNPNAGIGLLGSEHSHVDFKVYLDGKAVNFNQEKYFVKSDFVHVEPEENAAATGNVIHIHAKGVPLRLFFESLGMQFDSDCFRLDGQEFCNDGTQKLKMLVNGAENNQFGEYVPKNLDKILITFGSNEDEIVKQLESITDYAKE